MYISVQRDVKTGTLYESILDPSATVSPAFQAVNIAKQTGKGFNVFVTSETEEEPTLQQVGGGRERERERDPRASAYFPCSSRHRKCSETGLPVSSFTMSGLG